MKLVDYIATQEEQERINYIFGCLKKVFPNIRYDERVDIIGIGEEGKYLLCYFKLVDGTKRYVKFKALEELLSLHEDVAVIDDAIGKTIRYFQENDVTLQVGNKAKNETKQHSMRDLEREMAAVEDDAVAEEQYNADENYAALDGMLKRIKANIPYPERKPYDTAIDYEDMENIEQEKRTNAPSWKLQEEIERYCKDGSLYNGHLTLDGRQYYIMDGAFLPSKELEVTGEKVWLINADDKEYSQLIKWWRYPDKNEKVQLSRNIKMESRNVSDVDIILDKSNELFAKISDAYLRKALIRNKGKRGIQSIIQTIQKDQEEIRSLPPEKSFIVQGCAGSGKTMVLLHRLRYLLYNKYIRNNEYIFLVPGNTFKTFISDTSVHFRVQKNRIVSYQEYYQTCLGKSSKNSESDISELVFPTEYLEKVYSAQFMRDCYYSLFALLDEQAKQLGDFCDCILGKLCASEKRVLEDRLEIVKGNALDRVSNLVKDVQSFTDTKINGVYENISLLVDELTDAYQRAEKEYDMYSKYNGGNFTIDANDARLQAHERLGALRESIEREKGSVRNASVFTALSHKNKLEKLQKRYNALYEEVVQELIAQDKRKYLEGAARLGYVFEGVSLDDVENIINELSGILKESEAEIAKTQKVLNDFEQYLQNKYTAEIESLNAFISRSTDILAGDNAPFENLQPAYTFFEEVIQLGVSVMNNFKRYIKSDEYVALKSELTLFGERTKNQLYAYLNVLLFNVCKKKILQEFNIRICEAYKHYWYLSLYCHYLTRPIKPKAQRYVFIDEAQDLSVSEIELIMKINARGEEVPRLNLFGDVNQTISTHGIKDWTQVHGVSEVYTLNQNFRNTNQVVDYCNSRLSVQMIKVGVDMESVHEYATLSDAIKSTKSLLNHAVFIVKDEYAVEDITALLSEMPLANYEIYTVKAVKGLEFKEVFVFDSNMSNNEKYIAYTRALAQLNVIKSLPKAVERNGDLILQGADNDENIDYTEEP